MKKLLAIMLAAVFLLSLSACGVGSEEKAKTPAEKKPSVSDKASITDTTDDIIESNLPKGIISRERALEIALEHARIDAELIRNVDIDFDRERGGYEWEVDFDYGGYEYSYDINAQSGEIIYSEKEIDD